MLIDINNLSEYKENNQIEAKKAKANIPNSIWETYSSFSNTDGGIILLGVVEKEDHSLLVTGVEDAEKLQKDFWNMINNREKVNINLLTNRMVQIQEVEGKQILIIMVPRADRRLRPVYVGTDPMKGTYRRDFEGDYLCTTDQVAAMYRDASDVSIDMRVLKPMDMEVLDMDTVRRYRNRFNQFHENHVWMNDDDEQFLRHIGAIAMSNEDMRFYPTAAGLLMFGHEYDIVREFPHYFLDYQEKLSIDTRWTHRLVSTSGDWSGNLYDFFFRVYPRITSDLPVPFITNGKDRIDETKLHLALREMLLNSLAHADHYGRQGIVIIKSNNSLLFSNPGDIRIGLKLALQGGVSDPRNETIMKMFSLVDIGERAGSGIPEFINVWEKYVKLHPEYKVTDNPSRTSTFVPFSIKALQEAGRLFVEELSGTSSVTQNNNDALSIKSVPTDKSSIKAVITDKLKLSRSIIDKDNLSVMNTDNVSKNEQNTDKNSIKEEIVDILVDVWLFVSNHPHTNSGLVAASIGRGRESAKKYLQRLADIGMIVPEGANRNRTYSAIRE